MARMMSREELINLRKIIEKAMAFLDDNDAVVATTFYPKWNTLLAEGKTFTAEEVAAGYRVQYNDVLYKVLQAHTVQESWNPEVSPSLFAKVLIPDEDVISEWEQPDSTNPYMVGDKVTHNGVTYESLVDRLISMEKYIQYYKDLIL
jgi:hypothetical protein